MQKFGSDDDMGHIQEWTFLFQTWAGHRMLHFTLGHPRTDAGCSMLQSRTEWSLHPLHSICCQANGQKMQRSSCSMLQGRTERSLHPLHSICCRANGQKMQRSSCCMLQSRSERSLHPLHGICCQADGHKMQCSTLPLECNTLRIVKRTKIQHGGLSLAVCF